MKLLIDRSKWLRGEPTRSMLLRESDGKMCCLGFAALQCFGADPPQIAGIGGPGVTIAVAWPDWLRTDARRYYTDDASELMATNDGDTDRIAACREERIAAIFAKRGIEVEFIDGPVPS